MDDETLERLREASGLRLDAEGRFWHRDGLVEHARTVEVLHRGIHRAPDGRWATRIGREWGYLEVEDTALFVQSFEIRSTSLLARLFTGEVEPVTAMMLGGENVLYARVRGERARLSREALLSLQDYLREEAGRFHLALPAGRLYITADPGPEPLASRR